VGRDDSSRASAPWEPDGAKSPEREPSRSVMPPFAMPLATSKASGVPPGRQDSCDLSAARADGPPAPAERGLDGLVGELGARANGREHQGAPTHVAAPHEFGREEQMISEDGG
jgi:hypothetical protein